LSILEASRGLLGDITFPIILGVGYLGLVSTALAMYLWNKSLALLDAGVVSLLFFAQPVVGAGLGAWLLRETLDLGFWVGAALIALGLFLSASAGPQKDALEAPESRV
jgi:drug/metabolite transporter (DMT)-like permease